MSIDKVKNYFSQYDKENDIKEFPVSSATVPEAAQALGIIAKRLHELELIDKIIPEPLGGAHRNFVEVMQNVKETIAEQLRQAQDMPMSDLLTRRFDRIMAYGTYAEK